MLDSELISCKLQHYQHKRYRICGTACGV